MDSENQDEEVSYMIREKVVNNPYILKVGTVKYLKVSMRSP